MVSFAGLAQKLKTITISGYIDTEKLKIDIDLDADTDLHIDMCIHKYMYILVLNLDVDGFWLPGAAGPLMLLEFRVINVMPRVQTFQPSKPYEYGLLDLTYFQIRPYQWPFEAESAHPNMRRMLKDFGKESKAPRKTSSHKRYRGGLQLRRLWPAALQANAKRVHILLIQELWFESINYTWYSFWNQSP